MPEYHVDLDWQERALHYGDGLFETLLHWRGEIPYWKAHYQRLCRGCERLSITAPEAHWLRQRIADQAPEANAVIKIIVSRGRGGRGLELPAASDISVFVFAYPWSAPQRDDISARLCRTRLPLNPGLAGIKHLNRLDYVLAAIELQTHPQVDEGILCDLDGYLVEGLISNLFFAKGRRLYTPSLEFAGVDGIMRGRIVEFCAQQKIPLVEGRFKPQQLLDADEAFFCNSVRGIRPLLQIDETRLASGEITRRLMLALNLEG